MPANLPPAALFLARLRDLTARGETLALVTVSDTKGSAPRETGATMAVLADGSFFGTIGGGALEWEAQAIAREAIGQALREGRPSRAASTGRWGPISASAAAGASFSMSGRCRPSTTDGWRRALARRGRRTRAGRSSSSARGMSGGRSCWRWPRCRSG